MDIETKKTEMLKLVQETRDIRARSDLYKMYRACSQIHNEMSKESVNCKRYQKVTQKYTDLEHDFWEAASTFDQWVTFAKLLY